MPSLGTQTKPTYLLHHVCIYDTEPRDTMWKFLRWNHGVSGYFTGSTYHITGEGHADYTFLGCGSPFQFQLEAPPFQFGYERNWWDRHGRGYNHICWVVDRAKASFDQLVDAGVAVMQEYTEFPTYNGFVVADPEGTWIEIMEYTTRFEVSQFVSRPAGVEGLSLFGSMLLVRDLRAMERWYVETLGLRNVYEQVDGDAGLVYLADHTYHPVERNTVLQLATPHTAELRQRFDQHGPQVSVMSYLAEDVPAAWQSAQDAGMESIAEPTVDEWTGVVRAWIREPNGNPLEIREPFVPED